MSTENKGEKVTTIGGGSGTPVVNEALILGGSQNIKSIVTVMDSGGVTGRMRIDSDGKQIAYSDALRTLLSLIDPESASPGTIQTLKDILRSRNSRQQDLGYIFFSHFFDREKNGFEDIQSRLTALTGIKFKGKVLPVTMYPTDIVFLTRLGRRYKGEHEFDDKRMSTDTVKTMFLDPSVIAYAPAIDAVEKADTIFFCCGSLHGSVLCNLLPGGMRDALAKSKAKKVLITNLVSTRNETHDYKPSDFVEIFREYSGMDTPIDVLVVPQMTRSEFESKYPDIAERYASEHSFFLGWEEQDLYAAQGQGIEIVTHNATYIEPIQRTVRHNSKELAPVVKEVIKPKLIADLNSS